jgi:hypothetical protein
LGFTRNSRSPMCAPLLVVVALARFAQFVMMYLRRLWFLVRVSTTSTLGLFSHLPQVECLGVPVVHFVIEFLIHRMVRPSLAPHKLSGQALQMHLT